jgi:hypothetical protein
VNRSLTSYSRFKVVQYGTQEEDAMSIAKKPLQPHDFPRKQDGTPIANTDDPAIAADVAERLNEDEARREEDKWSA